jgi:glycine betaine/choline ABC-type transport system substrate-binding protein
VISGEQPVIEGFTVRLKENIGPTEVIDPGLLNGSIDLYPEYTGGEYRIS